MFSSGGFNARTSRRRLPGTEDAIGALVALAKDDPDKALVMSHIGQLVAGGFAVWELLETGEVEVRFPSGETYLLAETTILRLA
ncbi:hypothetical protein AB4Z40_21670 [Bosea sp. 2YAB26]|uniref:hypothetical protein n=1 Tax=Bosea sp. 2YAB26 TaxID=3237478 RepID=UPI003F8DF005